MKISPIDKLVEELWYNCVSQIAAKDSETSEKWQKDEYLRLVEGFSVKQMPDKCKPLVDEAIAQWEQIEKSVCSRLRMNPDQLIEQFELIRNTLIDGNDRWQNYVDSLSYATRWAVRNMEWVNLFSWVLPAADIENSDKHRKTGRIVTAIFYIELLSKKIGDVESVQDYPINRIEARWRFVNRL